MSRLRLLTAIQVAPCRCRQVHRRREVVQLAFQLARVTAAALVPLTSPWVLVALALVAT